MVGRGGPIALVVCGLVALLLLPIATAPANEAGTCGRLFDTQVYKDPHERSALSVAFEEQRQEASCDDARLVRWVYVAGAVGALLLVSMATGRTVNLISGVVAGLLALAAALDGPVVPLLLAAAGPVLLLLAQRRARAADAA